MKLRRGYDRIYRTTRYFRQMLSYEEVQRRLDAHYGGKLTIVEYRGTNRKGVLHCKECGEFTTRATIKSYLNQGLGLRQDCEKCTFKNQLKIYNKLLDIPGLVVIDFYRVIDKNSQRQQVVDVYCHICNCTNSYYTSSLETITDCKSCREASRLEHIKEILNGSNLKYVSHERCDGRLYVDYKCKVCGHTDTGILVGDVFTSCKKCRYNEVTKRYIGLLAAHNCIYLGRFKGSGERRVNFECNSCGTKDSVVLSMLHSGTNPCSKCNANALINITSCSKTECDFHTKSVGKILIQYISSKNLNIKHLFCGRYSKTKKHSVLGLMCKNCSNIIRNGKPKDHNKHLVEEYLVILYNVQKLKDFFVKHNQLQNIPEHPRIILEHIDGWINNYTSIIQKYPNGDLGTVLENNPLYKQCEKVFYPIMDKYKIERIETLGGK